MLLGGAAASEEGASGGKTKKGGTAVKVLYKILLTLIIQIMYIVHVTVPERYMKSSFYMKPRRRLPSHS